MDKRKRAVAAKRAFAGYEWRPATEPDRDLTQVSRGTQMGEYMRRFWQPVAMTSQLEQQPLPVRLLGEDLVLFRDGQGDIGLLYRQCSHRHASLEFGKVEPNGLRCCYHGWLYGADGTILEKPGNMRSSSQSACGFHPAYPVVEHKGFVFAYMGPPDERPPFPIYDYMELPGEELVPFMWYNPCNWLQVRENTQDPIHINFLHSMFQTKQFGTWAYELPEVSWQETPIGQIVTSTRRVGDKIYVRINELILPNLARVPDIDDIESATLSRKGRGLSTWVVPIDDESCWHLGWYHFDAEMSAQDRERMTEIMSWGQTGDRPYSERHGNPGDWDAWVSQGTVSIHGNEQLTRMDGAIALYRKQLKAGLAAVANGAPPKNVNPVDSPIMTYASNRFFETAQNAGAVNDRKAWKSMATQAVKEAIGDPT